MAKRPAGITKSKLPPPTKTFFEVLTNHCVEELEIDVIEAEAKRSREACVVPSCVH